MSKRRLNQQQSIRVKKKQDDYCQQADITNQEGLVLARFGSHAEIEDLAGTRLHCAIRPNLDALVAGDHIIWQALNTTQGVIVSRFPRKSILGRPDKQGLIKPIAANISQVIIVVAIKPELVWSLLDSYLIMAEHLALNVCIVLNKIDLVSQTIQDELLNCYQPLGYPILFTSHRDEAGYTLLKEKLKQQTSVFVGQSGVGKSTLISKILPLENHIQTANWDDNSDFGQHTTSNSRLYHLPSGGSLIDSPGIREFGLWHMSIAGIAQGYREFQPLLSQCKFRNCNHHKNPGCAIKAALNEGAITPQRYANFLKISMRN